MTVNMMLSGQGMWTDTHFCTKGKLQWLRWENLSPPHKNKSPGTHAHPQLTNRRQMDTVYESYISQPVPRHFPTPCQNLVQSRSDWSFSVLTPLTDSKDYMASAAASKHQISVINHNCM